MNASGLQRNGRAVLIECIIAAFKPFCSKKTAEGGGDENMVINKYYSKKMQCNRINST